MILISFTCRGSQMVSIRMSLRGMCIEYKVVLQLGMIRMNGLVDSVQDS